MESLAYMTDKEVEVLDNALPASQNEKLGTRLQFMLGLLGGVGSKIRVDATLGSDAIGDGSTWSKAYKTIAVAVAAAADGDQILLKGTFTEAVTCSKKLSFIGVGTTVNRATWMEASVGGAGSTLLTLTGTDCLITNIRFRIPTTGGIGINMSASDYTIIDNCHFQGRSGSYYGVYVAGGSQWKITNCIFEYLNTATYGCGILGYSTTSMPTGCEIAYNTFHSSLRHVKASMRQSFVHDNLFQEKGLGSDNNVLTATVKLDVYGEIAGAQYNTVTRNMFQGTYSISGGYKPGTNDNWYGNKSDYISQTGVTAEGTTTAVPA